MGRYGDSLMDFTTYQWLSSRTAKSDQTFKEKVSNFSMGLAGESGELIDMLKKSLYHGHNLSHDDLEKEIGDILWYLSQIAFLYDIPLDRAAERNIEKLKKRYPEGFSEERSIHREE